MTMRMRGCRSEWEGDDEPSTGERQLFTVVPDQSKASGYGLAPLGIHGHDYDAPRMVLDEAAEVTPDQWRYLFRRGGCE